MDVSHAKSHEYVELRIHGVSGTPPVDMLDSPLVRQVAGDEDGRFFRPVDAAGEQMCAEDGHIVEGYHWGPLTSGTWRQALWLVLVPFGLVNAAYFMLPAPRASGIHSGAGKWPRRVAGGAFRAIGIVLTGVLVLSFAQAVIDLLAWQWSGLVPEGSNTPRAADPTPWLAGGLGAVLLALLGVRLLIGRRRVVPDTGTWRAPPDAREKSELADGAFYSGDENVPSLYRLHLAAAYSVLAVLAASVARTYGDAALWDVLFWLSAGLLGLSFVHAALLGDPRVGRSGVLRVFAEVVPLIEMWCGVAVLAGSAYAVWTVDLPAGRRGVLPGVADVGMWVSTVTLIALVTLVVAAALLALRTPEEKVPKEFGRFLKGMAAPAVAALGVLLAVGFTAALDYGVLRVLRPPDPPGAMELPVFHLRIAYAAGLAVALAAAVAIVILVGRRRSVQRFVPIVRAASNRVADDRKRLPEEQVRRVAGAWWLGRLKYALALWVFVFALAGTVLTAAAVLEAVEGLIAAGGATATIVVCRPGSWLPSWLDWLSDCRDLPGPDWVTIGTGVLFLVAGFLLYLGRRSLGDSAFRRGVCVVWDLVAFWPSVVHPLVPPPYAPKVIEDLRRRIAWHLGECYELDRPEDRPCTCPPQTEPVPFVVLAGHSQGSLIAVAALTRLAERHRDRVALLTFGSQLQIAYARAFPAYVNVSFLRWVRRPVLNGRWLSLYRETDPIGGPVLSRERNDPSEADTVSRSIRLGDTPGEKPCEDEITSLGIRECGDEWRLLDPEPADGQTDPREAMRRHSAYTLDRAWSAALTRLTNRFSAPQPTTEQTDPQK